MSDWEEVPCNLCGSTESLVRFSAPRAREDSTDFSATTDRFGAYGSIRRCRSCGLQFTSPRPSAAALAAAYADVRDEDYFQEAESRSINAYMSLAALRRHAKGGRLLELGCATGFFLNAARLYFEVEGVEPSRWAREYAQRQLKLKVSAATLSEAAYPPAVFDAAAMIDVIEHLADPAGTLREVARVCKPGAVLYLVTPDIDSLSAALLGGHWWGLRPAHVYYFSRDTLTALLDKAGFDVVEVRSYGRIFTWRYWLTRLANYPRFIFDAFESLVKALGIEDKFLYLDTRDSMQVIARKRA